jgi:transposase
MNVSLLAIDLAKNTFQVCGVNRQGKEVFNRPISRKKLTALIAQYPGIPIAMEACSGSNYWGRTFQQNGHEVLLIPPPHFDTSPARQTLRQGQQERPQ